MPFELADSFGCGPFVTARNPDVPQFVDKLNKLREAVDQCRIQPGVGYTLNRGPGGTTLSIKAGGGGVSALVEHPFKLQVRIQKNKHQFYVTQGMVGDNKKSASNADTWVDFTTKTPSARIYLEAELSEMLIEKLTLKTMEPDLEFNRAEIVDGQQKYARISIGSYVPTDKTKADYRIVQNVTTDLVTPLFCYDGYPAFLLAQENINNNVNFYL